MARGELAAVMDDRVAAHRYARLANTAPGFGWLVEQDRTLQRTGLADRHLCVVMAGVEDLLRAEDDR
jgi:hypothetical protein